MCEKGKEKLTQPRKTTSSAFPLPPFPSSQNVPFMLPQARHQRPIIIVDAPNQHTSLRGGGHVVLMRDVRVPPQAIHGGLALVVEDARALVRVFQVLFYL